MDLIETMLRPLVWVAEQCMPAGGGEITPVDIALTGLIAIGSIVTLVVFVRAIRGRGDDGYEAVKRMVLD